MMKCLDSGYNLEETQVRIDWLDDRWRGIEDRFLTWATKREKLLSMKMGKAVYEAGF